MSKNRPELPRHGWPLNQGFTGVTGEDDQNENHLKSDHQVLAVAAKNGLDHGRQRTMSGSFTATSATRINTVEPSSLLS